LGLGDGLAAADPVEVRITGSVPFTSTELESALALRATLATPGDAHPVVASIEGDGPRVRLEVTGRQRIVQLDAQGGADAARLVAFAILDLASDQLDPPAAPDRERIASFAPPAQDAEDPIGRVDRGDLQRGPQPPQHLPRWSAGVWVVTGTRQELVAELGIPVRGPVHATASVGVARRESTTRSGATVDIRAVPARLGVAWRTSAGRLGSVEARLSAIGLFHRASADRSATDVVFGAGAALVWATPIPPSARHRGLVVLAGGGVDGFMTAREFRVSGTPVATTNRVAWWAGLALAGELWR